MTIFEFTGQFLFQNDVFKLQEVFLEPGIRETVFKTRLKTKEATYTVVLVK
jgi:hypothetical protein